MDWEDYTEPCAANGLDPRCQCGWCEVERVLAQHVKIDDLEAMEGGRGPHSSGTGQAMTSQIPGPEVQAASVSQASKQEEGSGSSSASWPHGAGQAMTSQVPGPEAQAASVIQASSVIANWWSLPEWHPYKRRGEMTEAEFEPQYCDVCDMWHKDEDHNSTVTHRKKLKLRWAEGGPPRSPAPVLPTTPRGSPPRSPAYFWIPIDQWESQTEGEIDKAAQRIKQANEDGCNTEHQALEGHLNTEQHQAISTRRSSASTRPTIPIEEEQPCKRVKK